MKSGTLLFILLSALSLPAFAAPSARDAVVVRRFAILASSNDGGPGRAHLRFANSDASAMARVLGGLGGVQDRDLVLIPDASRDRLKAAVADITARIAKAKRPKVRSEMFLYFSGHSDEEGLLLGEQRVLYRELRAWMESAGADVRIGILDSCASGALIRLKGGTHRPPFLSDVSTHARGHAYLTASSADEAAQESDRVGAAFFTHYLVSGLRGAADANRDNRVTLMEAYQFAYNETLQRTQTSRAGAQHPNYDIQLAGSGDLVMTDLHSSNARLVLPKALVGRIYIRDAVGRLIVELRKEPLYPVELGLEPGNYALTVDTDGRLSESIFALPHNGRLELAAGDLRPVAPVATVRRGDEAAPAPPPPATPSPHFKVIPTPPKQYRDVDFDMVFVPGLRLSGDSPLPTRHGFAMGILTHSDALNGLQLSLAGGIIQDEGRGVQIGGAVSLSYGPFRGVQLASTNIALNGLRGAQIGYLLNYAKGPRRGAQLSMVNISGGPASGAQIGLVNLEYQELNGAQVGLFNSTKGTLRGAQVGLVNLALAAEESNGAQVGLVNVMGEGSLGNLSMVGLVNVGQRARCQIGLVNVAQDISVAQVGLVNFARRNTGISFGLLPMVIEGDNRLTLSYSDHSLASAGLKVGTRRFYVRFDWGMTKDFDENGHRFLSSTFGLGIHLLPRGGRFTLDLDASTTHFATTDNYFRGDDPDYRQVHALRFQVGYWINRHLALVAGPSLNVQTADVSTDRRPLGPRLLNTRWTSGSTVVRMYPGLTAGLEF